MDFNFDGLTEPIRLPDEYLTVRQWEMLRSIPDNPDEFRKMRDFLAAILEDPGFIERTDSLPMTPHNLAEWNRLAIHLHAVITASSSAPPLAKARAPKRKRSAS